MAQRARELKGTTSREKRLIQQQQWGIRVRWQQRYNYNIGARSYINANNATIHKSQINIDGYGEPDAFWNPPFQCEPTQAPAGSAEKIEVLAERFRMGQELFHDDDPWYEPPVNDVVYDSEQPLYWKPRSVTAGDSQYNGAHSIDNM